MYCACTSILMGVTILVSEILLLSKTVSDHGLWSMVIKKFNCLELAQKIMQVEVNVLSMHTNFDGCRHSSFGDTATFKNGQISLSDHGL